MTGAKDDVVRRLHQGLDPFNDFEPFGWTDLTDEWDSHHPYFDQAVDELRPRVIVEVGSFLGASSRHFAARLSAGGTDGVVVCVDTWLAEQVLWDNPQWRPHLRLANGRPQVYNVWMANAIAAGLEGYLCPLSMDSASGARYLAAHGVRAELVYIDGSHAAGDVRRDLELYWALVLAPGGIMLVDDVSMPEVAADLAAFAQSRRLAVETGGIKARLRKAHP